MTPGTVQIIMALLYTAILVCGMFYGGRWLVNRWVLNADVRKHKRDLDVLDDPVRFAEVMRTDPR